MAEHESKTSASRKRARSPFPSVDTLVQRPELKEAVRQFGRPAAIAAARTEIEAARAAWRRLAAPAKPVSERELACRACARLEAEFAPSQKPVYNLTGTVLHTNLGRALLAEAAIAAATEAARSATALEFNLETGKRGERDDHIRGLIRRITGAEDATVVNNNAAAVVLVLNTLAKGREAIASRGELIEIGGSFRMPDIMESSGCRLREVGTTNRTHLKDYVAAIGPETGCILKVHTSNYVVQGFTKSVCVPELAELAHSHGLPLIHDLGSGTLTDLRNYGLKHEPTVAEALAEGADLVTFSGDKLLGGPQAGLIAGRADLIARINKNPLKRALRLDKLRLAALEATLKLYLDPESLPQRLPTLRLFLRKPDELRPLAGDVAAALNTRLEPGWRIETMPCESQIGSGALPLAGLPSLGLALKPSSGKPSGRALEELALAFRRLPRPVIGRIAHDALIFDLRCLEEPGPFMAQLQQLAV